MSSTYTWINPEKRERLENVWCGSKFYDGLYTANGQNDAVLTLVANRWSGDRLIWYPDEGMSFRIADTPFKRWLRGIDEWEEFYAYRDMASLFPEARGKFGIDWNAKRPEDEHYPYNGPFDIVSDRFRYVVNHGKRQFIDRHRTAVQGVAPGEVLRDDLFPALCIPTDWVPGLPDEWAGMWFGDVMEGTNDRPGANYENLTGLRLDASMPTCLGDEEILAYVCDGAPDPSTGWKAWREYVDCRLRVLLGKVV